MSLTEFQLPRLIVIAILKVGTQRVAEMELSSQAVFFCYPNLIEFLGYLLSQQMQCDTMRKLKKLPQLKCVRFNL